MMISKQLKQVIVTFSFHITLYYKHQILIYTFLLKPISNINTNLTLQLRSLNTSDNILLLYSVHRVSFFNAIMVDVTGDTEYTFILNTILNVWKSYSK